MPQTTDRTSYHTRSEKSEQSLLCYFRLCYSGSQRKAILSPST